MAKPGITWRTLGITAMLAVLFAILVAAGWFASRAWTAVSGPPMPAAGYAAMILGIVFSLVVGCGLMALVFYSSRHGYDDQFKPKDKP
jgi:cation transporter-like permease